MTRAIALIAARMGSTRFPGKVLAPLGKHQPILQWVLDAARCAMFVDETWICTTTESRDDAIIEYLEDRENPRYWRGPEDDVLARFAGCIKNKHKLKDDDLIVRLTGDCPFLDPRIIDEVIALQHVTGCVYANNTDPPTYPDGLDVQVVTVAALLEANALATRLSDRNTVVEYISRNRQRYPSRTLICPIPGLAGARWVVDTQNDYRWAQTMVEELGQGVQDLLEMLSFFEQWPNMRRMGIRNERFYAAIASQQEKPV